MGKRSDFLRLPQDSYDTPESAVAPLLEHLGRSIRFIEPCAGNGHLIGHLKRAGHICVGAYDLPDDARTKRYVEAQHGVGGVGGSLGLYDTVTFITNPPWSRPALHQIIENLADQAPTWLLIDADWLHTKQAIPHLPRLGKIVSVGRVKWIPDSPFTGKDNCAWCLFKHRRPYTRSIEFFGRADSARADSVRRAA